MWNRILRFGASAMAVSVAMAAPGYDGQALFQGVFFAAGPVAKYLPEIWHEPAVAAYFDQAGRAVPANQSAASRDEIVSAIEAQGPDFFERFAKEMQSGDRIRINQAFQEARERFWKAIDLPTVSNAAPSLWYVPGLQRDVLIDLIARRLAMGVAANPPGRRP